MSVALLDVNVLIAILETFNLPQVSDSPEYILNLDDLPKFAFLYSPESQISLNIDLLWQHYPEMAVPLAMVLLSPRFLGLTRLTSSVTSSGPGSPINLTS